MLSYQHIYHAGCVADVHKHAILASLMARMTAKPKPMTYFETHAGRGLYDLDSEESQKTGEAAMGIDRLLAEKWFAPDHPYMQALKACMTARGPRIYPGSPLIASHFLREGDKMHLMELHPQEVIHLKRNMRSLGAAIHNRDGFEGVMAISPPTPRRGLVFIDPSYEVKTEYTAIPEQITRILRKWSTAVIALWYPLLPSDPHWTMVDTIVRMDLPGTLVNEVEFFKQGEQRGLYGSGVVLINAPFGFAHDLDVITERLTPQK